MMIDEADSGPPIVMIHWGALTEEDEFEEIKAVVMIEVFGDNKADSEARTTRLSEHRILNPDPIALLNGLKSLLQANTNVQVIYFSAHGNLHGIAFNGVGDSAISYRDLFSALREATARKRCITLVFGTCCAMHPNISIEQYAPDSINRILGFSDEPSPDDVAGLLAGVIKDGIILMTSVHEASVSGCGEIPRQGLSGMADLGRMMKVIWEKMEPALNAHEDAPASFVPGQLGTQIVDAQRNPKSQQWTRTIHDI